MEKSIFHRKKLLTKARDEFQREAMKDYDKEIYYPALQALIEECGKTPEGHTHGTHHNNGLGWEYWYCSRCGVAHSHNNYWKEDEQEN